MNIIKDFSNYLEDLKNKYPFDAGTVEKIDKLEHDLQDIAQNHDLIKEIEYIENLNNQIMITVDDLEVFCEPSEILCVCLMSAELFQSFICMLDE